MILASVPIPKFAIHRGTLFANFGIKRTLAKVIDPVWVLDLKFLYSAPQNRRNFKSTTLAFRARSAAGRGSMKLKATFCATAGIVALIDRA